MNKGEVGSKIGFFDSGIGGLSVLYKAIEMMPNEDYIYYADTKNQPYGTKDKVQVKQLVFKAIDFIVSKNVKAIVVACNTATSVAIEDLRKKYDIPIIGMEPAVKPAVLDTDKVNKKVLVTATKLTLKEEKLHNLISALDGISIVDLLELQELVQFAERLDFDEERITVYLKKQFCNINLNDYQTLVLGCTRFTFFKDMIQKLVSSKINIIDGNEGTIRHLQNILRNKNGFNQGSGKIEFYNSGVLANEGKDLERYQILFKRLEEIEKLSMRK